MFSIALIMLHLAASPVAGEQCRIQWQNIRTKDGDVGPWMPKVDAEKQFDELVGKNTNPLIVYTLGCQGEQEA